MYGSIDFVEFPKNINILDLKFSFIIAPPIIRLWTLLEFFSAKFLIKIVPSEIPTKWDFFIFSASKTSRISSVIELNVYFFLKGFNESDLDFPWPLRSKSRRL